ncbi:hypothetical protein PR048_018599 [Dryococelus australis]|uniref:Uncharacterized protein n=1 Tax=Dryococelus australis TaxID=614101 RepID=A0ABQ9HD49_9NEOP|nr:hypothetical protein PR048_018599 [Dryococelus australis]
MLSLPFLTCPRHTCTAYTIILCGYGMALMWDWPIWIKIPVMTILTAQVISKFKDKWGGKYMSKFLLG